MHPICYNCAHYFTPTGSKVDPEVETCTAFYPNPIPDDIMQDRGVGHDTPHPDQQNRDVVYLSMSPMKKRGS
jgi:hypothetical protein